MKAYTGSSSHLITPKLTVLTYNETKINALESFAYQRSSNVYSGHPDHYHVNCFELTYVDRGNLIQCIGDREYKMTGGDVFVAFPNEIHRPSDQPMYVDTMWWLTLDIGNTESFLFLDRACAEDVIAKLYNIKHRIIKTNPKIVQPLIKNAFEYALTGEDGKYISAGYLSLFLHMVLNCDNKSASLSTPQISKVIDFILMNLDKDISLDELAEIANLSLSRFKQLFKDETGQTPRVYINCQKIYKAKKMLLENRHITDVAMNLGFSSSNYFAVFFKRYTSYSPSEFINKSKSE